MTTTFAFVDNGVIAEYPVGSLDIRRRFPGTSFPKSLEGVDLSSYGVATVVGTEQPIIDPETQKLEEGTPAFNGTQWDQVWNVVALSAEEQQQITDYKAAGVRADRNKRLADSDWTQVADAPVDAAAWAVYRAALRAVPEQAGFPSDVVWPPIPGSN